MGTLTTAPVLTSKFKPSSLSPQEKLSFFPHRRRFGKKNQAIVPVSISFLAPKLILAFELIVNTK